MDEVLEKFGSLGDIDSGNRKTDFEDLYKNWGRLGNQEQRRKDLLATQRSDRYNKLDTVRGILEIVNSVEDQNLWQEHKARYRPQIYVAGFNKVSYKDVLMMSEWLIEKPHDFQENWLLVPCPKGVRMIVVANSGTTKCYTKYGQFKFEVSTALPSGNPNDIKNRCSVLDCFYHSHNNTMFVLDLLAWNNQTMTDGETEFRHFWLKSKFAEIPQIKKKTKINKVSFSILPQIPCQTGPINKFLSKYPAFARNHPPLDGLLFYHKNGQYVGQETPLVGWLFPYMVNEILGEEYTVHPKYLAEKPVNYTNQRDFIQTFDANVEKKKPRWMRKQNTDTIMSDDSLAQANSETPATMDAEETIEKTNVFEKDISRLELLENCDTKTNSETPATMDAEESIENTNVFEKAISRHVQKNCDRKANSETPATMDAEESIEKTNLFEKAISRHVLKNCDKKASSETAATMEAEETIEKTNVFEKDISRHESQENCATKLQLHSVSESVSQSMDDDDDGEEIDFENVPSAREHHFQSNENKETRSVADTDSEWVVINDSLEVIVNLDD